MRLFSTNEKAQLQLNFIGLGLLVSSLDRQISIRKQYPFITKIYFTELYRMWYDYLQVHFEPCLLVQQFSATAVSSATLHGKSISYCKVRHSEMSSQDRSIRLEDNVLLNDNKILRSDVGTIYGSYQDLTLSLNTGYFLKPEQVPDPAQRPGPKKAHSK